jgi:hypothetical protein
MITVALHLRGNGALRSPGQIVKASLVPYSFESTFLYSDLSTRFEVAESHAIFRERVPKRCMWGRGSCIFRCLLLSRDSFANLRPSLRRIEAALSTSFRPAFDPPCDEPFT